MRASLLGLGCWAGLAASLLAACGKDVAAARGDADAPGAADVPDVAATVRTVNGRVSAGPIVGADVDVFLVANTGAYVRPLASTVTDASGAFSVDLDADPNAFIAVEASGGSYQEEADGTEVATLGRLRLFTSVGSGADVGVTPLTEIAVQRALAAITASASVQAAMADATFAMAHATGLPDITRAPADPHQPVGNPTGPAARYALLLGGLSQLAQAHGMTSLDLTAVLGATFGATGSLDAGSTSAPLSVTTLAGAAATVPANVWSGEVGSATAHYLATRGAHLGLNTQSLPLIDAHPPLVRPAEPGVGAGDATAEPDTHFGG